MSWIETLLVIEGLLLALLVGILVAIQAMSQSIETIVRHGPQGPEPDVRITPLGTLWRWLLILLLVALVLALLIGILASP